MHVQYTLQTKLKFIFLFINIQPCIHSHKMLDKTLEKIAQKNMGVAPCIMVQKCASPKKVQQNDECI